MENKTKVIENEDYISYIIEEDCNHFLLSFYEDWQENCEEVGTDLFGILKSKSISNLPEGLVATILEKHELRISKRIRLFFDSLIEVVIVEEKKEFREAIKIWISDFQEVVKKFWGIEGST